jgi:hypothetical protein
MPGSKADILITRAANTLRKAAALDRKRRGELDGVADYLETMVYEAELRPGQPKLEDAPRQDGVSTAARDVKRMIKPFKVRLVR